MDGQNTPADADEETTRVEAALLAERLRLYQSILWTTPAAQGIVAMLLVAVLWGTIEPTALFGWVACLTLAIGARLGVALRDRAAAGMPAAASRSALWRVRLLVACSGAAWGLAGVWLFPAQDLQAQTFLAFLLAGMAAGSLTVTAFDLVAALAFATLALVPLVARLLAAGGQFSAAMAAMVMLFVGFLALAGMRAQRNLRDTVALRSAESRRAEHLLLSQKRLRQLSEELTRRTEELGLTLDSMDQGILSMGADGRLNFHNRRLSALLDLPESLLQGRPTMEEIAGYQVEHGHFGPDLGLVTERARQVLARWIDGERPQFPASYFRRTPAGAMLEVKTRYLSGGGLVRTFSDVTAYFDAQQRLQDSQAQARKLALVAAHTDNAVAIIDARRHVEWVNDGFTRLTGYSLEEVVGRQLAGLLRSPSTDAAEVERMDEQLSRQGKAAGELLHRAKDGHTYWFAVESQAILDDAGEVVQYISIGRDVSARHAAEQALRAARDEAERASRAKSEFLSAMSHELRTPMNAILGFAQLLQADATHLLPERQRGHVHQILRAGAHLLELINDVLDLARVEAGKQQISIEPVQVSALMDECLALMRPLAQERDIRLDEHSPAPCGCWVAADRTRLKQVLLNLLSNAIKYNRDGGAVHMGCDVDGDEVRISVSDTGQGLAPDQRERLFNAFERLGAETGPIQGAGIGLALSRRMIELMQGSIGIDSQAGEGSTFWVRLHRAEPPVQARAAPPAVALAPAAAGEDSRTVLYIEDNPVNVVLMEAMLEREPGVRLLTAQLPQLGLDLARTERPDLILLDIQLPGIDGYEVLRRLRAAEATRSTTVVAISANAMRGDIEQGLGAGFDGYLTKPLDLPQLLAVVRGAGRPRPGG